MTASSDHPIDPGRRTRSSGATRRDELPRVVVVGDALVDRTWDGTAERLCPDAVGPVVDLRSETVSPGGAALTALAASALGAQVCLVTALGEDDAGDAVRERLATAGIDLIDVGLHGPTPEKIRVRCAAGTVVRLDRGCVPVATPGVEHVASPSWERVLEVLRAADAVLLSDYGRGCVASVVGRVRRTAPHVPLGAPASGTTPVPVIWDPHPASDRPDTALTLATPNLREARAAAAPFARTTAPEAVDDVAAAVTAAWDCSVAVTCSADGAVLATRGAQTRGVDDGPTVTHVPTTPATGDPCGAGDWFAAGTAVALGRGEALDEAVGHGCRAAAAWVERGPTLLDHDEARSASGETRCSAGVVATSGCFDVLHVGHLSMLRHARSLGDRLVVLVNSDASVRRLKGSGRPVNTQADRVALLEGLACVDEVRVFDELTPCEALRDLRPAVFVKGADYAGRRLPEEDVVREWHGRVELAPLVSGRSTTRVLRLARDLATDRRVG